MSKLKFGWHLPSFPVDGSNGPVFLDQLHQTLSRIQSHFDSVWVDDHMMPWAAWQSNDTPYTECLTTLAYFAATYPDLQFGTLVFCQSYRNPALLAKTAANLQLLMGGRFLFGIGAGWMEEEYHAYNFDLPKTSVRIAQMEEAVQIVRKGLTFAYQPPMFRPFENYPMALLPEVYEEASQELLDLLGFKVWFGIGHRGDFLAKRISRDTPIIGELKP